MSKIDLIALAGILHDIGKFRQRCGFDDLNEFEIGFALCDKQKCSYLHSSHTAKAIEEMRLGDIQNLITLSSSHHKKNLDADELIIQKADRFASSLDRKESIEEVKQKDFIEVALQTPFSYVWLNKKPETSYYFLQKFEENIKITSQKRVNSQESYKKLYNDFISEAKKLNLTFKKSNDFLKLKSLLEKYTTFIPASSYKTYPDVSLFDHLLATSAIAVAIKRGDGENFSLIQGDFTSIQSFIFSKFGQSNKYQAKILRAKSLFVNISTELVALKICKELDLNPLNIVLNAGGKFTILSHKLSSEDLEKLENIKDWVNKSFEEINFLQTKFVIKSTDFTKESFKLSKFADIFKKLAYEFEKEKLRFIPKKEIFKEYIKDTSNGICEICGIVPLKDEKSDKVCKYCSKFKEIGEKLPKAKYINFNLEDMLSIHLSEKESDEYSLGFTNHPIKRVANVVPKFKSSDINNPKYKDITQETQIKEGMIKSFYHIANDGYKIDKNGELLGKNYLAVLKADIDNLGEIFIRGFNHEKNEATFSRVLYLSRMIDYFFTNILMDFIKDKNVYTVFAGGDDLFLIGHYEDIIKTYEWIVEELKKYTRNDDFHLSAGINLSRANVPLPLMADFTEDELDSAKAIDSDKNAVTIFGVTLKNSEFLEMLKYLEFFEELYQNLNKVQSGITFMYRFYDFIQMQKDLQKHPLQNARWKYLLRYLIEKNFEVKKSDKEDAKKAKEHIKEQLIELGVMIERYKDKLIIPLNLFLYSKRK